MSGSGYLAPGQALALFALQPDVLPAFMEFCRQFGPDEPGFYDDTEAMRADLSAFIDLLPLVESRHRASVKALAKAVTR